MHVGYFVAIALVETNSATCLIRLLRDAYRVSPWNSPTRNLLGHLLQSTEIRLASLCCIGILRAVTYWLQTTAQSATTVAGEFDRFAYTLECVSLTGYYDRRCPRVEAIQVRQSQSHLL